MGWLFLEYPKCSTCRKAKKWLEEKGVEFEDRHIVENPPTVEELQSWLQASGLEIKKFFNTSGQKYKELGVKDLVKTSSEEELISLLASDGMLVKRPILTDGKTVVVGFKEEEWSQKVL